MKNGQVVIRGNEVVSITTNIDWNNQEWPGIIISRQKNGQFKCCISTPEGGGLPTIGDMKQSMSGLHPKVAKNYENLFLLGNPSEKEIEKLGFRQYEIMQN